jgi:hypothetical protein
MSRPRDSFRSRTLAVIGEIRTTLGAQGLLPELEISKFNAKVRRLEKSQLYRKGLAAPGQGFYVKRPRGRDLDLIDVAFHAATSALPADAAWTGREFSSNFIKLLDVLLGKEAGRIARSVYKASGLKYSMPRQLSDEQKAATADRLLRKRAESIRDELIAALREV